VGMVTCYGLDSSGIECSGYGDLLWTGQFRDWMLVQVWFSAPIQTNHAAHPTPCIMGTGSLSWRCGI